MKKLPLIIIIVSVLLISVALIIAFNNNGKSENKNEVNPAKERERRKKKEEESTNLPAYEQEELYDILSGWAQDLYLNKNYDKCVKNNDGSCFLSLESLEKNYGKDISKFKDEKRGGCLLDSSGITFYLGNEEMPFSFSLEGCEYLDISDIPIPSLEEE